MRPERTIQASLFDLLANHETGRELKAMSGWLDEHPELVALVARALRRRDHSRDGGAGGSAAPLPHPLAAPTN